MNELWTRGLLALAICLAASSAAGLLLALVDLVEGEAVEGTMKAHITYLKYVLRHKWFVFFECCKLGNPWLGIIHDLSKFSRAEWRPYVLSFYSGWKKDERPQWVVRLYERALQHHIDHNKHHWEHWCIGSGVFPMPDCYRKEMLADWIGAGRAKRKGSPHYGGIDEAAVWYGKHKGQMHLYPDTRLWIERQFDITLTGEPEP